MFSFHKIFSPDDIGPADEGCRAGTMGCVEHKDFVSSRIEEQFRPMRERRHKLEQDMDYVHDVFTTCGRKARERAQATMAEVRDAMGLDIGSMFTTGK